MFRKYTFSNYFRLFNRSKISFYILLVILLSTSPSLLFGQIFTRVMDGPVVNDFGSSAIGIWWDFDNDEQLDLYVANWNGENNFLYKNNEGVFAKIDTGTIVQDAGNSYDASIGDFDNDGNVDLYVANGIDTDNFLYKNNGEGRFTKIVSGDIVNDGSYSLGSSWGDYNNDGNLDIFVANYNQNNLLFKNNGDGTFTKVISGQIVEDGGASSSATWADFDNDGDLDLFVANLGQNNFLYENNGDSSFTKITDSPVTIDGGFSTGGSWGDCDNDGYTDLFVTNSSGNRNFFYRNNGDGTFSADTAEVISKEGGKSLSSSWADFDNDGDLDLVVVNYGGDDNFLYHNNGDGTFTKEILDSFTQDDGDSRGSSWGDLDNDGDLDLIIANYNQNNFLYINNGNDNNWINIKCEGNVSNRSAIGTKVWIKSTINEKPTWQLREISGQTGNRSQNSLDVEFGLGDATVIDSLKIEWPSGLSETFTNIDVNQFISFTESGGLNDLDEDNEYFAQSYELRQNYPNPFNPSTSIDFNLAKQGSVKIVVYNTTGQTVRTLINNQMNAGHHSIIFNAEGLSSGVYFYQIEAGEFHAVKRMILLQ